MHVNDMASLCELRGKLVVDKAELENINQIDGAEKLEAYLKDKPIEWSMSITARVALRVFQNAINPGWLQIKSQLEYSRLVLSSWRAVSITTIASTHPDINMRIIARHAARASVHTTTRGEVRTKLRKSAFAAYTISNAAFAASHTDNGVTHVIESAVKVNSNLWHEIKNDLHVLWEGGDLVIQPLFYTEEHNQAVSTIMNENFEFEAINSYANSKFSEGTPWVLISDWYRSIVHSNMQQTPWDRLGSDVDLDIAGQPNEFWDRQPDEVIADIARMVGWPDYNKTKLSRDEVVEKLTQVASPEPRLDSQNRLDIQPNQIFDQPKFEVELETLPQTLSTLANTMAHGTPPNAPTMVKPSLQAYSEHLNKYGAKPILGTLKSLAEIIKADFSSRDADEWSDGLQTAFVNFWEKHLKLLKHFPRDFERDEIIKQTEIDEDAADTPEVIARYQDIWDFVPELDADKQVSPALADFMKGLEEQLNYARNVPPQPENAKEPSALKRFTLQAIGIFNRFYGFIGSSASIGALYWVPPIRAKIHALLEVLKTLIL